MTRSAAVCVFSERREVALELLAVARDLADGGRVVSVAPGTDDTGPQEQIVHGADEAFLVGPQEGAEAGDLHVAALRQVLERTGAQVLLVGATAH
jgi:electron transfer flavoprotein alpha/beta subunit